MNKDCGKYQQKLSAYLDSQLDKDEQAEFEGHLESCPDCQALLTRFKQLHRTAGDVMENISDDVLKQMEERIMSGIEFADGGKEILRTEKRKVIPIWYRYVAVAASVVLVFMIGKMAYDESVKDFFEPTPQSPIRLEQPERKVSTQAGGEETGDEKPAVGVADEREKERVEDKNGPSATEEPAEAPSREDVLIQRSEEKAIVPKSKATPDSYSEDRDEARLEVAEPALSNKMTDSGKEPAGKKAVEPETVSSNQKRSAKPLTESGLGKSPRPETMADTITGLSEMIERSDEGSSAGSYVQTQSFAEVKSASMDEEPRSEAEKEPEYISLLREKIEKNDNSLEFHYARQYISAYENQVNRERQSGKEETEKDRMYKAAGSIMAVSEPKTDIANPMLRIQYLYFSARACYDRFKLTGDRDFLLTASRYRERALDETYNEQERGNRSRFIEVYRDEINKWDVKH